MEGMKHERYIYEESLKHYRDLRNVINSAERRGREEGREEGRAAERMSIAKSLLANGISLEMIVRSLNLTPEEVKLLSQKEYL